MLRAVLASLLLATPATAQDLAAIGRLAAGEADRRPSCTATLIGPRQVLTARHCAGTDATGQRFFIGWSAAGSRDTLRVVASRALPADPDDPFATDYAVLTLARPAAAAPLPLAPAPLTGGLARVVSYPWEREYERRDMACAIRGHDRIRLQLGCPAEGGMSGAPVLVLYRGAWAVAGVVVARIGDVATLAIRLDTAALDDLPAIR